MAEELAFDQTRADGGAIHLHQRPALARAVIVDGASKKLLAGTGVSDDQHGRIRGSDLVYLPQHLEQRRAVAEDFAEVVFTADFLPQVGVLGSEPGLLLLHQHAVSDIDEHRARGSAAAVGPGPPLNPNRLAAVMAAKLEHDAARVRPPVDGFERLAQSELGVRRVGDERLSVGSRDFFRLDSQNPHRRAVGANETGIEAFVHIGNRSLVEQIAEALLAFGQLSFAKTRS